MGLPSNASLCTSGPSCGPREDSRGGRIRTRIIPAISFTCSGTVTGWRAAGEIRIAGNAETNSVLSIWRERSNEPGTYDRNDEIEVGICGSEDPAPLVTGMSGIYECNLPQSKRVSVQPGDVVGIELPAENRADFRLYFNSTNNAPTNYVFSDHGSTFSLSQAISSEQASDQPQVSLTVVPDNIATTIPVLPTTQPPSMTEASSTMADLPTPPQPLTFTSMATTDLEAPTSTEALATMTAPSEIRLYTTTGSPTPDTALMTTISLESTAAASITTEFPASATTDAQAPSRGEAVKNNNIGTVAGSAVSAIIAVLLILIIVLLLVLVLRRKSRNGQKYTPSNSPTIVNPNYNGKSIVPSLESNFH